VKEGGEGHVCEREKGWEEVFSCLLFERISVPNLLQ
jgi:hypothetical protein